MIPLSKVGRLQESRRVRGIRASDEVHRATAELSRDEGLSPVELERLEEARPGRAPWES